MAIHTFGDSHSRFSWDACDDVFVHHLGAMLCHSFGRDKLNAVDTKALEINPNLPSKTYVNLAVGSGPLRNGPSLKDGDTVVFCFGEIDCRCHVHKHASEKGSFKVVIDKVVDSYIEAIELHVKTCGVRLKNVCIYNVPPAAEKNTSANNPHYPFKGSDQERKEYVLYFNEILSKKCKENNFIFIDIYNSCTNSRGFLSKRISDGHVHITDPEKSGLHKFIKNELL